MTIKSVRLEPGVTETPDRGGLAQLFLKCADAGKLVGVELSEGAELVRIFHRAKTYEPGADGEWTFGQTLGPGDYVTVIAKTTDGEVRVVDGALALEGDFAEAPAPAPLTLSHPQPAPVPTAPAPTAPTGPKAVTPGMNEVVVLLLRGDAEYLLRVIRGEMMNPSVAPAFERAFREALS